MILFMAWCRLYYAAVFASRDSPETAWPRPRDFPKGPDGAGQPSPGRSVATPWVPCDPIIAALTGREKRASLCETFDSRAPSGRLLDLSPVTQGVAALLPGLGCRGHTGRGLLLKLLLFRPDKTDAQRPVHCFAETGCREPQPSSPRKGREYQVLSIQQFTGVTALVSMSAVFSILGCASVGQFDDFMQYS